jgi:hypothetical protein
MTKLAVGYIVTKAVLMNNTAVALLDLPAVNAYPNLINLDFGSEFSGELSLYTMLGSEVYNTLMQGSSASVDLSDFDKGIYFIRLRSEGKNSATIKVVRE